MSPSPWDITRDMFLSADEVTRLLEHVRRHPSAGAAAQSGRLDRLIVETLLFSGVRCSEFCRLTIRDFDVDSPQSSLQVIGSKNAVRCVWLPRSVSKLLAGYLQRDRAQLLPEEVDPHDPAQPLFFNEKKRPFERTGLYRRVVRILSEIGLGDRASVQLLRHTYGYLAYARTGGNLLFVQRQLGHAHPMITSIYAQFVEEDYAALADGVARPRRPVTPTKGAKI